MLTTEQIILLAFIGLWMAVSIVTYVILFKYTKQEYRKFYPHPIVNIQKNINGDNRFKFWEKLFIFTCLNIVYLPIICEWLIAWCLYKFWKFIYVDDTQLSVEEENEIESMAIEIIKEECSDDMLKDYVEAVNNPEYISKEERESESQASNEFMESLKAVQEEIKVDANIVDKPVEQPPQQKPKRKYTPRKKTTTISSEEVKVENDEAENN